MNVLRKNAAVAKFTDKIKVDNISKEEFIQLLQQDEKAYTAEEADEIYEAILLAENISQSNGGELQNQNLGALPNQSNNNNENIVEEEKIDLSKYNYSELSDNDFKEYDKLINSLSNEKLMEFELYAVEPVLKARYAGLDSSPIDFVGVRTKGPVIATSKIAVKHAKNLNAQVRNTNKYYLLKK